MLAIIATHGVFAQTTAFSYQGSLSESGQSATGVYDFKFSLFADPTAGTSLATEIAANDLGVTNGLFNVFLDYGASAFDGSERYLEVSVRPGASTGAYTTLLPRQRIAASPNAIQAGSATTLQGTSLTALQTPVQQLQTRFDATNSILLARLDSIAATLSNVLPSGVTAASTEAADPGLTTLGYQEFAVLPAGIWTSGSVVNAPEARFDHSGVWNGTEFLIWGGRLANLTPSATGFSYRPDLDQWSAISTTDAPSARSRHAAVWTGTEMIAWGGAGAVGYLKTGARLGNGVWRTMALNPAISAREGHAAVWTGSRLVIFGGLDSGGVLGDAYLYDPSSNAWQTISLSNSPTPRTRATAVWTGDSILIWGGEDDNGPLGDGWHLTFAGNTATAWVPISSVNAPAARTLHSAIWTGAKMLVWGGDSNGVPVGNGAAYDPAASTWTAISNSGAPSERRRHNALWTGSEMLILGGENASSSLASGFAYNPAADKWRPLSALGNPSPRTLAPAVWTGSEVLTFGGKSNVTTIANLQRLNPQSAWRLYRKP